MVLMGEPAKAPGVEALRPNAVAVPLLLITHALAFTIPVAMSIRPRSVQSPSPRMT
jgi:hypothetical protein